ncbi:hypothetical protein [Dermatobacter hominis]|uniref:hypothetical protein n=1 Tax=Dermatobacter hominis TaxID=2884263 RepID=UPI001D115D47|nr:hypothetical protein [Dermatobacter hominis]UDY36721.1 hypothetical protein LH044_04080 [Dermatobacter hominis]
MTTQQYPQQYPPASTPADRVSDGNSASTRQTHTVRDVRETRPSFKTTEFWVMLVAIAGILVATYADSDSFDRVDGWRFVTFVVVGYLISRGLAKVASYDRVDREMGDRDSR